MTILDTILLHKRGEVADARRRRPVEVLQAEVARLGPTRGFAGALARHDAGRRIIAEVKKASPSKGVLREDFDPVAIAVEYARAGAAAISVLTDERFFQGHLEFLVAIRAAVETPLLRKDFLVDPYQVWEARAAGADAVLVIVAALTDDEIRPLVELAAKLGLDVLWEVHDASELERAKPFGPRVIGVNNRDLRSFEVSLETTRALIPSMPPGAIVVSESGFFERSELERMEGWGAHAFLIGESLIRRERPGEALAELLSRS